MDNYKKSTFSPPKIRPLGPVHLDWISDKLDYLRSPSWQKKNSHFFSIEKAFSTPEKWDWNWLGFLSLIFSLGQCVDK